MSRHLAVAATIVLVLCTLAAAQQQGTINHGVYLRPDPSTKNRKIATLKKGATVSLIDAQPSHGFYHVKTADGTEGWVGIKYVDVQPPQTTGPVATTPAAQCDGSLWDHVYNPDRLVKKQDCISVTGQIVDATNGKKPDGVRHEADGDTHGWLKLNPGNEQLLNAGNMSDEGGNLVFEIVCEFKVTQADAKSACQGYKSPIQIPAVGSHVRITGTYVQDTNHAKWMEIHPVSSITVVP